MEPGDDLADEGAGLTADVTLAVHQQLIEEGQRLGFLAHGQVGEILPEHVQIGPQLLPAFGRTGGLDEVAELLLVGQHVHQLQVVLHRQEDQAVQRLVRPHKSGVLMGGGVLLLAGQVHVHPQAAHVVLKIVELAIDKLIPAALFPVHVVQLGQDHLKGLVQGVEDHNLIALFVPLRLGAEVGVDQQQGLHRQGLQLQVPGGVVGSDVADVLHLPLQQPLVGVVVVEVGHPLPGAAAEFAHVVGGGGGGDQSQVHLHPRLRQPPGGGHGDVVDPGNVAQGLEGGELHPQAHQLVEELPPPGRQEPAVLPGFVADLVLLLGEELEVQHGIKGQGGPLLVQQDLKDGEVKLRPAAAAVRLGGEAVFRVHDVADILVGEGTPALLRRFGAQPVQDGRA